MGQEWEAEEEDLEIFQGIEKKGPKASWKSLKSTCWERAAKVPCQKEKGKARQKEKGKVAKAKGSSLPLKMVTQVIHHQKKLGMNACPRSESAGTFSKMSTTTWMKACQKLQHVAGFPSSKTGSRAAAQRWAGKCAETEDTPCLRTSGMTVEKAKDLMLACTAKAKEIKEEKKELDQVASKAMSKATTKR
eukprot:s2841_g2.t1